MMTLRKPLALATAFLGASLLGNACLFNEGCLADVVPPGNATAVVNSGLVTVSWDLPEYDTVLTSLLLVRVQYATAGGPADSCTSFEPKAGCAVGCEASGQTSCNVNGLTPGTSYSFSVITRSQATNPSCSVSESATISAAVTP